MELIIQINMDNAAFGDSPQDEAARIIREFAAYLETNGVETYKRRLADINGNTVGRAEILQD